MKTALALALSWLLILPASKGGEYHRYAVMLGVPEEILEHFQLAFGDETFGLMHDPDFGMVLEDPAQTGMPFMPSFTPTQQWGGDGPPAEPDSDYAKRMTELEHASFAKGFAMGLGYGGYDMVTSTGKAIWGAAKFVGRAHLQVGLRFKWVSEWMTGGDTTRTEEMLVAVDAKQQEVIDQGLQVGKFLGAAGGYCGYFAKDRGGPAHLESGVGADRAARERDAPQDF